MAGGLPWKRGLGYLALPLLGAAAAAGYLQTSASAASSKSQLEMEKRLAQLERQASADRRQLAALRGESRRVGAAQANEPIDSPAAVASGSANEDNEDTEGSASSTGADAYTFERQEEFFRGYFEELDALQKLETRDNRWATEAEAQARQVLQEAHFKGSQLESAECRETLCRFVVTHDSESARSRFGMMFLNVMGQHLSQATIHGPVGARKSTVYASRVGHEVPTPSTPPHE